MQKRGARRTLARKKGWGCRRTPDRPVRLENVSLRNLLAAVLASRPAQPLRPLPGSSLPQAQATAREKWRSDLRHPVRLPNVLQRQKFQVCFGTARLAAPCCQRSTPRGGESGGPAVAIPERPDRLGEGTRSSSSWRGSPSSDRAIARSDSPRAPPVCCWRAAGPAWGGRGPRASAGLARARECALRIGSAELVVRQPALAGALINDPPVEELGRDRHLLVVTAGVERDRRQAGQTS